MRRSEDAGRRERTEMHTDFWCINMDRKATCKDLGVGELLRKYDGVV